MGEDVKAIINQALELSSVERAIIAEQLLLSLDSPTEEIDEVWAKEAEARIKAYERGDLQSTPMNEVFSKYE
ncbi:hypothetical protein R50073_08230 [Maricurvus nonylphenolicus]|uniref:addiction module protein n=1 Tax=Maricurvus nonylphenolicus TaxID=1008307 RepID=UPI0036F2186F